MPSTIFILADSSIELLPESLYKNNLIKKYAKKRNKDPSQIILDSNYHYKAMYKLEEYKKRGRPDILHFCLLNLLGSPFIKSNSLYVKIFVHTINNILFEINPKTRLPKNYNRFI